MARFRSYIELPCPMNAFFNEKFTRANRNLLMATIAREKKKYQNCVGAKTEKNVRQETRTCESCSRKGFASHCTSIVKIDLRQAPKYFFVLKYCSCWTVFLVYFPACEKIRAERTRRDKFRITTDILMEMINAFIWTKTKVNNTHMQQFTLLGSSHIISLVSPGKGGKVAIVGRQTWIARSLQIPFRFCVPRRWR